MAKIQVYRTDTGEKLWVPAHWMKHPKLSSGLSLTPKTKADEAANTSESADSADTTPAPTTASRGANKPKE